MVWGTSCRVAPGCCHLALLPLCSPLPLSVGRICDLLLVNRIQQRWQGVCEYVYVCTWLRYMRLYSQPGRRLLSYCLWRSKQPFGKAQRARSWGQSPANSQQETEFLSPTAHHISNSSNKHMRLEAEPSPVKPQMRLQLWEALKQRTCLNLTWNPALWKSRDDQWYYLKPLSFGWYHYPQQKINTVDIKSRWSM